MSRRKYKTITYGDTEYEMTPAYRAGAQANRDGVDYRNNPHRDGSQAHNDWNNGHANEEGNNVMGDKITWSGKTSSYPHKWNDTPNPDDIKAGFRKVWFLDAQWSTCPIEVENQVKDLWWFYELGNDHYMIKSNINDLLEIEENDCDVKCWDNELTRWSTKKLKTNAIVQWIREQAPEIKDDEQIIIHWWW